MTDFKSPRDPRATMEEARRLEDAQIEALLRTPDKELVQQALDEGQDVAALVTSMKVRIAAKLAEAARQLPPAAQPGSGEPFAAALRGLALGAEQPGAPPPATVLDADIAGLDLGPVSYLAVLQHGWNLERAAEAEREYRGWLQHLRDFPDRPISPGTDCDLYWRCHIRSASLYLEETTAIFGHPLLRWPAGGRAALSRATQDVSTRTGAVEVPDGVDAVFQEALSSGRRRAELAPLKDFFVGDREVLPLIAQMLQGARTIEPGVKARQRLRRGMRRLFPDRVLAFPMRIHWGTGAVDVDQEAGPDEDRLSCLPGTCARCTRRALTRALRSHTVPLSGSPAITRITVHQVEADRCEACGLTTLTPDGKIKVEYGLHQAILHLSGELLAHR